ncbi:hypothetical protein HID58_088782 [Brassica napus]|uniref:Uncharacterized protein n=1 Tax=Brassica napus TaxID=3708 RepID=A0ABQ7XX55_BRANA|nr:hypothetical protein HID58_088782 [Brassica napus]
MEDIRRRFNPVAMTMTFGILFPRRHTWRFSCPEVMVGINVTKIAPHIIHCTTGNAFDHTLLISGMYTSIHRPHVQLTGYIQHRRTSSQLSEWTPAYASTRTPHQTTSNSPQPPLLPLKCPRLGYIFKVHKSLYMYIP